MLTVLGMNCARGRDKYNDAYWKTRCECGTEKDFAGWQLKTASLKHRRTHCGCKSFKREGIDITGQVFGYLTALGRTDKRDTNGGRIWRLRCDCGSEIEVAAWRLRSKLKSNARRHCGCRKQTTRGRAFKVKNDLTNKRFGKLFILGRSTQQHKSGTFLWDAKCDCGTLLKVLGAALVHGHKNHCGCEASSGEGVFGAANVAFKGVGELSGDTWSHIRHTARVRDLTFAVTKEHAWELFLAQNRRCALSGLPIQFKANRYEGETTASLDRKDSNVGYVVGNLQWVHKDLNRMKWKLLDTQFIEYCRAVVAHHDAKQGQGPEGQPGSGAAGLRGLEPNPTSAPGAHILFCKGPAN